MISPYRLLERKRAGQALSERELHEVVQGAADGSWSDAQLGAFLMAAAIRGLDEAETRALTLAMRDSGDCWRLADEIPQVCDKHSTGGVGDKISLLLAPLLASCGLPIAMLTGRGLGHTGGTADKLESIPGVRLDLDRAGCLALLSDLGLAIGMATGSIAPADRRLYALRDLTATIDSLSLITASILSKKLATGAAGIVFDVKTGNGAFLPHREDSTELGRKLVAICNSLGVRASALVTDMSQPLGEWCGHAAEVAESLRFLSGEAPEDLLALTLAQGEEVAKLVGHPLSRPDLERALASGRAYERFLAWAERQGADRAWLQNPELPLAPVEVPILAPRSGVLNRVETKQIGLLLAEVGGGRIRQGDVIDFGVSLHYGSRLGRTVEAGEEIARVYLRREDPAAVAQFAACFHVGEVGNAAPPALILERIL